jgi:hypothetical protein
VIKADVVDTSHRLPVTITESKIDKKRDSIAVSKSIDTQNLKTTSTADTSQVIVPVKKVASEEKNLKDSTEAAKNTGVSNVKPANSSGSSGALPEDKKNLKK